MSSDPSETTVAERVMAELGLDLLAYIDAGGNPWRYREATASRALIGETIVIESARGFHLRTELPDGVWVSTMYDGNERPDSGPYETCILGTGHDDNPVFHWRTQAMAQSAHQKFVALLGVR